MKRPDNMPRIPVIALVGRPNVGKSTLFNRLIGEKKALVDDQPGVTRDRNYGRMEYLNRVWELIDTGGFEPSTEDDVLRAMLSQTRAAIAEADGVVFILDGRAGVTPSDHDVADVLRRSKKPVFFAVNKIDGPKHEEKVYEFHALGIDQLFGISAEHSYGLDDLLDAIAEKIPGADEDEVEAAESAGPPRVMVLGRPNVGKSTLINALLGEERHLVHDKPGTTRDAIDSLVKIGGKEYLFIDTAGMRRKARIDDRLERFSVMRSLGNLERCHLAVLVLEANEEISDQDAKLAGLALDRGRALILVFNKWDLVEDKEKRRMELDAEVKARLTHVDFAPVITISARDGTRVTKLGTLIDKVMAEFTKRIPTGELNKAVEEWTTRTPPPSPKGKALKIYYATQPRVRPPDFVFFVNRPDLFPMSYQRYLVNQMRATFGFAGSPIRIHLRPRKKEKEK